jgi:tetratricopeptide (TPR) repeat protein
MVNKNKMAKEKKVAEQAEVITETATTKTVPEVDYSAKVLGFWDKNKKNILVAITAFAAAFGGYFAYKNLYKGPKEEKAEAVIFRAEGLFDKMANTGFNKDSINLVLNGGVVAGNKVEGLLKIVSSHSGTNAANRANYMIGATYLHNKEFDKAIKYLKEFSANGAYQMDIKCNIMLGHANAELKKTDEALKAYKAAAAVNSKDDAFTSDALFTAASYADFIGKTSDALELFKKLKNDYPGTSPVQNGDVYKYLAKLGEVK